MIPFSKALILKMSVGILILIPFIVFEKLYSKLVCKIFSVKS